MPARQAPSRDVFLLGAGFARAISPSMPLLQGLAARVLRQSFPRRIPPAVQTMMRENFAHALSYLEQAKPWVTEADNLRHRALFLEFSNAIARDLEATVSRVLRGRAAGIPGWIKTLIGHWHHHRHTVLTLNYDTLIETIAATVLFEGTSLRAEQLYPPLLTDAGLRSGGVRPDRPESSFRLLKLHGSTNWYYSGRQSTHGEPIYFVPPLSHPRPAAAEQRAHEFRMSAVADKYPFLVPPVYDKSPLLTHETIRALWFEAGNALQHATRLVCLGYSLPESDLTMKHFLRTSCPSAAEIAVVDPSPDAHRNFQQLFKGTRIRIRQHHQGNDCIARFVSALAPCRTSSAGCQNNGLRPLGECGGIE